MDDLVRGNTFVHDDKKVYEAFTKAVGDWTNSYKQEASRDITAITKGLAALGDQLLTVEKKPQYKTKGWDQAAFVFNELVKLNEFLLEKDEAQVSETQEIFYSFMVRILDDDLNVLHLSLVSACLDKSNLKIKDHIQDLDKSTLEKFLTISCCQAKIEKNVEDKGFLNSYEKFTKQLISETLKKSQTKDEINILLDFVLYSILECTKFDKENYRKLSCIGKIVLECLEDPFSYLPNVQDIKAYIKKCEQIFTSKTFIPRRNVRYFMAKFMEQIGERGLIEELYNEVFDLMLAVSKCTYTGKEEDHTVQLLYEITSFFRKTPKKGFSKNAELFDSMCKRFCSLLEEIKDKFLEDRFADDIVGYGLYYVYADNKTMSRSWVEMLIPLFKRPHRDTMKAAYNISSNYKSVNWKDHVDVADQVVGLILMFEPPAFIEDIDGKVKDKIKDFLDYFKRSVEYFFDGLKKAKILKNYGQRMMKLSLKFMATNHTNLIELAESIAERTDLNIKEDKNAMIEHVKELHELIKNEDLPWPSSWPLQRAAVDFLDTATEPVKDGKIMTDEDFQVFLSICLTCLQYDCINPETGLFPSTHYSIFLSAIKPLNRWLIALNRYDLASPLVPELLKCLDVDDENVVTLTGVYLYMYATVTSGHRAIAPYLDKIMESYLKKDNIQLLQTATAAYPINPKALRDFYRPLMSLYEESGDPSIASSLLDLFQKMSQMQAELFTDQDIEVILNKAQESSNSQAVLILQELTKRRPESMLGHIDTLLDRSLWNPALGTIINEMLIALAFYKKDVAPKVLDDQLDALKTSQDKTTQMILINTIRMLGFKYPDLLKPRRSELENIQISDPECLNLRQAVLDMIDGKTSDEMVKMMKKQEEDLVNLIGRVDETAELLTDIKEEVSQQGEKLASVESEVKDQGQRLNEVEVTVEETVAKVEEIDQKTLSHAPYWSRDVSKLLNPTSEHDWRLLSQRLQYSNDDIRGWAQQADPCMAMLNEWYATHKTSEATLSILTQLQEMDRMDAAIIVENAMKNAEAVVEDEAFEYASPPPIFISYQWGHQNEVKLLKQHLEMAGYECWLDIGQMGGGDKLFEKIDTGIRAAKVVISCVTTKYAKSPNCNREVNLSVSLNKPIIPLLLEQCPWPPPGSMGPIFSEYLFIRFFQRKGEELEDQRFWPKDKFQELLMQFNVLGLPPVEDKVQPVYRNWWTPVVEEIKIDKSKTQNGGQASETIQTELDKKASDSPDVFISYQWGKQKNIIKLYERLTSLGFSCWLDIKQMGGGDSLFDKIDRGIRGCKVVLSCVTQKYALSANCRREVSLTDALKKPLVPLLMEQMTWPPAGPMSMVMTQLLYINFAKDEDVQLTWEGPKFEELLSKIKEHVPMTITNIPDVVATVDSASSKIADAEDANSLKEGDERPHSQEEISVKDESKTLLKEKSLTNTGVNLITEQKNEDLGASNTSPSKENNITLPKENDRPPSKENHRPLSKENKRPPSVKNKRPLSVENSKPTSKENNKPTSKENNRPPSVENNRPPSVENNGPPSVENKRPPSVENSKPTSKENNRPQSVENNRPPSVENNGPQSVENKRPPSVENNRPPSVENNGTPSVENNGPLSVENNGPQSVENKRPPSVENNRPTSKENNKPTSKENNRPPSKENNRESLFQGNETKTAPEQEETDLTESDRTPLQDKTASDNEVNDNPTLLEAEDTYNKTPHSQPDVSSPVAMTDPTLPSNSPSEPALLSPIVMTDPTLLSKSPRPQVSVTPRTTTISTPVLAPIKSLPHPNQTTTVNSPSPRFPFSKTSPSATATSQLPTNIKKPISPSKTSLTRPGLIRKPNSLSNKSPNHENIHDLLQLTITSKQLLKPISTDQNKNSLQESSLSDPVARTQQSKYKTTQTRRPLRLPPLQQTNGEKAPHK